MSQDDPHETPRTTLEEVDRTLNKSHLTNTVRCLVKLLFPLTNSIRCVDRKGRARKTATRLLV